MLTVIVLTGLGAGLGGAALTLLLHLVQHLAFGYTEDTFLTGVERASPAHRVSVMGIGGLLVGLGWWALRHHRHTLTVTDALRADAPRMPLPTTLADSALQILAVAFGASLGREGAHDNSAPPPGPGWPHEPVSTPPNNTILACGAGAGLAAVYNVPLGGALFTLGPRALIVVCGSRRLRSCWICWTTSRPTVLTGQAGPRRITGRRCFGGRGIR